MNKFFLLLVNPQFYVLIGFCLSFLNLLLFIKTNKINHILSRVILIILVIYFGLTAYRDFWQGDKVGMILSVLSLFGICLFLIYDIFLSAHIAFCKEMIEHLEESKAVTEVIEESGFTVEEFNNLSEEQRIEKLKEAKEKVAGRKNLDNFN